jgi:alkanesulfonate monooxygenase SsuD/methylene tetrahydromethanopterin reductase-like flavin-dependent oxidoreductase (luciferase family)
VPAGAYDPEAGAKAYRAMVERLRYIEELGFDWVSVSEHHYSPRILTPSPVVTRANIAAVSRRSKSPCWDRSSARQPVRIAEELAMLDTMCEGRLVAGCCAAPRTNTSAMT